MDVRRDFQFDPIAAGGLGSDSEDGFGCSDDFDWSKPESFLRAMGGPMPRMPSPSQIRKEAREHAFVIFSKYDRLREIVKRHEATVQKRWTKRTRQQRLHILLQAWPGMPASHRPDFEALRNESEEQREKGTRYYDHYLWPSINREDLSQTKTMLLLLNSRGRHPPSRFAAADSEAMHLGLVTRAIVPDFLNGHTMLLNRATTADKYGEVISWDSHPDAFDWMNTLKEFIPGEGLLVLKMQARLMTFLVDCCHALLHDIADDALISDTYPVQPEPPLKTDIDASGFVSLAAMAAEAPYRLPAQLDLGRLESLLEARMLAAEDHVWSLREDPAYYVHEFLETKDHRQEMVPDTRGHAHPITNKLRQDTLSARIIMTIVTDAYISLDMFTELHGMARNLRTLQQRYDSVVSATADLPHDYLLALLRFRYFLANMVKVHLYKLKETVVASPSLRRFSVRIPPVDVNSSMIQIMSRMEVHMNKSEQHLIWLLRILWEDDYDLFLVRLPDAVDELERLLQSDPHANSLTSAHILGIISDVSILAQCSRQLELYQPWARSFEHAEVPHIEDLKRRCASWSKPWTVVLAAFGEENMRVAAKLGDPSTGRFTYPVNKRRSKVTVDALRQAEIHLDTLWAKLDEILRTRGPNLKGTALQRLLSQPRILRRTAKWVEPQSVPAQSKVGSGSDTDTYALKRPLSNLFLGSPKAESEEGPSVSSSQAKVKTKTRGTPSSRTQDDALSDPANDESTNMADDPRPTFPVDNRSLKVFRTLFFNPETTSTPGSIPWNDFLHAMVSAGFTAEKLYGSIWQFSPCRLDVERSIHFHEPHPSGKLPFEVARRYGRRLTRTYGWYGGMFVLKG